MKHEIGIVTCCYKRDYAFAKAAVASVRHFLGEIPLCVVVDGNLRIDELVHTMGVIPLYVRDLKDQEFSKRVINSNFAKLAAYVEGPFERFVFIDSDVAVWGNPLPLIDLDKHDFVIMLNTPHRMQDKWQMSDEDINHFYFDIEKMKEFDPGFEVKTHPFFSTGVFATRRDCFSREEILQAMDLRAAHPGLFKFNDMPLINYMLSVRARKGNIKYQELELQFLPAKFPGREMAERFPVSFLNELNNQQADNLFLHFCGFKPYLYNWRSYKKPFTYFRAEYYRCRYGSRLLGLMHVYLHDLLHLVGKLRRKLIVRSRKVSS